jgi:hypothetical protein
MKSGLRTIVDLNMLIATSQSRCGVGDTDFDVRHVCDENLYQRFFGSRRARSLRFHCLGGTSSRHSMGGEKTGRIVRRRSERMSRRMI